MMHRISLTTTATLALSLLASSAAQQPAAVLVLQNVTVVNTHDGSLSMHRSIVIEAGRIKSIVASPAKIAGAQVVDGTGKFVVPGYADMHAHLPTNPADLPSFYSMMIANGITALREESAGPAARQAAASANAEAAAGKLVAPEIIFQGGEEHLLPNKSALEQSNAGKPSIDHLGAGWGLILDCSTEEQSIRAAALAGGYKLSLPPSMDYIINPRAYDGAANAPFYQRILDTYSESKCASLSQAFAKNHTWQTVTLIRLRTQDYGNDPVYRNSPDLKYVSKETRAKFDELGDRFASSLPPAAVATLQAYYELQKRVTRVMIRNGAKILAGSDVAGVWLVPGISLHQEFHELASAGLTPLEILQATTLNAAEFLNRQSDMGSVEAGRQANLVLLDSSPAADSVNLDKIHAVVVKGQYLPKSALSKLEDDVAQGYK